MNSSGIKRGLATTAVSALAIAGIPFIASPASAAPGDNFDVVFTGPALNGAAPGAVVILEAPEGEIDPALLELTATGSNVVGSQNNDVQSAEIISFTLRDESAGDPQEFGDADGNDEIVVRIQTTTNPVGATAAFRIFEDDTNAGFLDASEARQPVSITTAGPVAAVNVAPATQTRPVGVASAPYTATLRDSAGRLTQATGTTTIDGDGAVITPDDAVPPTDVTILTADDLARGTTSFTATGPGVSVYNLGVTNGGVTGNATLSTIAAATLAANEVDIVTGADDWDGFGGGTAGGTTVISPTENTITFNFRSTDGDADGTPDDANSTVTLDFDGNGVTFGGQDKVTKTVTLNAQGVGSITLDVDPGTIQNADSIAVSGSFAQTLSFAQGAADALEPGADRYVTALDGTTTVTVTVVDDFGNPVSSGEVSADIITGPNANALNGRDQRKPVAADGTVSFTFTDVNAVNGQTDVVEFEYFNSQFDNTPNGAVGTATTQIRYTTDGQGSDFVTTLDTTVASGPGYNPAANPIVPLADGVDNGGADSLDLNVLNAETGTSITVTASNGALILEPGETTLAQASSSITDVVVAGALPSGYNVIGTQSGPATLTIVNAGRTETADFVVAPAAADTGRNIELSGPSAAVGGDVVTFVATITDAFGNPVEGFQRNGFGENLNVTVSGPGALQDGSAQSDANGEIALNVRLSENADSPVTVNVTATGDQFGAQANREFAGDTTNTGPGLTASDNTASATIDEVTDIEALEEAVAEAERNLAESEANLAAAQAELDVAQAELAIAQSEVDRLKERKQNLRQKLNKAKRNDNRQKAKTTRKKLRNVKRQLRDAKAAVVVAQTAVDGEQVVVDLRKAEVEEAEAALAEAQADLDEAQN